MTVSIRKALLSLCLTAAITLPAVPTVTTATTNIPNIQSYYHLPRRQLVQHYCVTLPHPQYATFVVTAYTANDSGMNGRGVTASGQQAIPWTTVAASRQYPFGTVFKTPDGQLWKVSDRGGAITRGRLDLYVGQHDTQTALQWGIRKVTVEVVKIGQGR